MLGQCTDWLLPRIPRNINVPSSELLSLVEYWRVFTAEGLGRLAMLHLNKDFVGKDRAVGSLFGSARREVEMRIHERQLSEEAEVIQAVSIVDGPIVRRANCSQCSNLVVQRGKVRSPICRIPTSIPL